MTSFFLVALALAVAPYCGASQSEQKNIVPSEATKILITPLQFHQNLLVCNACPGWEGVDITRNGASTASGEALPFNECRHIEGKLFPEDRITFDFKKEAVSGTFAIDTLPQSDSQLLLIVQKRGTGNLLSFQSFAFPPSQNGQAQVAFLNTIPGDSGTRVRMSDVKASGAATREEEVMFNRVYGIEAGAYDITDERDTNKKKPLPVRLAKNSDYVVLKTGTENNAQLVVFPNETDSNIYRKMLYLVALLGPIVAMVTAMAVVRKRKAAKEMADKCPDEEDEKNELVV